MKVNFDFEEMQLMEIYNIGTLEGLIVTLTDMRERLEEDETEMMRLTDSTLEKLAQITTDDYDALELYVRNWQDINGGDTDEYEDVF